ncbi:MAG: hypothetical protein LBT43_01370 [Prevotella sp.]|jgi:hypothetical protein|nr:hypothetical protein [Prevotella sp.]
MSYNSFVYDNSLIEEKQAPVEVPKGMVAIRFSRRGLAHRYVQKDDYKLMGFGGNDTPVLNKLTPPAFGEAGELCFYRKGIRDGYIYVCDPVAKFWLVYKVTDYKYMLIAESDSSKAKEIAKKTGNKTSQGIVLPEKDEYMVSFSPVYWTSDFLNNAVKTNKIRDSLFTKINIKGWKDAVKQKAPAKLPAAYTFGEDMYELTDLANNRNPFKNIENSVSDIYKSADNASQAGKVYSDKQKILYFTLDDTLGVVEDLGIEMIRFVLYKEAFNRAVQKCVPISDILSGKSSTREGSNEEYQSLYSSATILHNMLYSNGGALNQKEHQYDKESDGKHKYQSKVQKYKLTKLLAVDERKILQDKYEILRDLLGRIMSSGEYKKEIEPFIEQSNLIKFAGQSLLMEHLKLLYIQPDCFDSDISLNNESGEDKWRQLIEDMSLAYMKIDDPDIKEKDSPVVKLLNQVIIFETLAKESRKDAEKFSNAGEKISLTDNSVKNLILGSLRISTTVLLGIIQTKREKNIDIGRAINKLFAQNVDIVASRKMQISDILTKYNIKHTPETVSDLYNKQPEKMKPRDTAKRKGKIQRGVDNAKLYNRRRFDQNMLDIKNLEIDAFEVKKTLPKWMEAKGYIEGMDIVLSGVNMAAAGIKVLFEVTDDNKQVTALDKVYYGLYIFGSSFEYMKKGSHLVDITNFDLAKTFGLKTTVRLKALSGFAKTFAADVIIFAAECVNSYRLLKARNPEAAFLNFISAGLSLLSAACISAAFLLVTGIVGIIILVVLAIGIAVAAYFLGKRAGDKEYDVWQSFLINSIFSNYYNEPLIGKKINTNLIINSNKSYNDIAYDLYKNRKLFAIDNYYYKKKEYNLQNFVEMLRLLDEMATLFEVNIATKGLNYSYEGTGNYIIPANLTIDMSYFGVTRFDSVDYFLYIDVFPEGNSSGVVLKDGVELNPQREEDAISEYGQSQLILTFNIWQALHNIKNRICANKEDATMLKKKGILSADESHITYPSNMTIVFGCRLVNSAQEVSSNLPNLEKTPTVTIPAGVGTEIPLADPNDNKRAYLPWEENGTEIFQGFKCRAAIPVPANTNDFSSWYYRNIYGHMVSGVGTMEDLTAIELRDIAYTIKEKK